MRTGDAAVDRAADAGRHVDAPADTGDVDTGPDTVVDAGCTADILRSRPTTAASADIRAAAGICDRGVCQPMMLAGVHRATSISVDATQIYFTLEHEDPRLPQERMRAAADPARRHGSSGGYSTWAVNVTNGNLFFMSAPTQAGTEHDDLFSARSPVARRRRRSSPP